MGVKGFMITVIAYFAVSLGISSADEPNVSIEKGTNFQWVGYLDAANYGDRGFEYFVRVIDDNPNMVYEAEGPWQMDLKRFVSKDALDRSYTVSGSFTNVGQSNKNDKTVLRFSRAVFQDLKNGVNPKIRRQFYSINNKGQHAGWESTCILELSGTDNYLISLDGILEEVPVLIADCIADRRDILNGWDYTDIHTIKFTVLDSKYPIILRQIHKYYKHGEYPGNHFANWNSSMVRIFSVEGLKNKLQTGLAEGEAVNLDGIRFPFGSDQIEQSSRPFVNAIAQVLSANPTWKVELAGHTDFIGSDTANFNLSERRSRAVKGALQELGVSPDQMITIGHGERDAVQNGTYEQRAWDRRVTIARTGA